MRSLREFVIDPGIRRHLHAALLARPILGRFHQARADALQTECFIDEPSFDESHWRRGVAAIGMRAQTGVDKPNDRAVWFRDKNNLRQGAARDPTKNGREFCAMFSGGSIGPQFMTHARQSVEIGGLGRADENGHATGLRW